MKPDLRELILSLIVSHFCNSVRITVNDVPIDVFSQKFSCYFVDFIADFIESIKTEENMQDEFIRPFLESTQIFQSFSSVIEQEFLVGLSSLGIDLNVDLNVNWVKRLCSKCCRKPKEYMVLQEKLEELEEVPKNKLLSEPLFFTKRARSGDILHLNQMLGQITANYKEHFKLLLARLAVDKEILPLAFDFGPKYVLEEVRFAHGDLHKLSGGVSILQFRDSTGASANRVRVVYKPSTVLPDFAIVGKVRELKEKLSKTYWEKAYDKDKKFMFSFAELINFGIKAPALHIPTYLVLPCEDFVQKSVKERITGAYGYIEYLRPQFEQIDFSIENLQRILAGLIAGGSDLAKIHQRGPDFERELRGQLFDALKANAPLFKKEDVEYYSVKIGLSLALVFILSCPDLHAENLIVHDAQPFIIDFENSMTPGRAKSAAGLPLNAQELGAFATANHLCDFDRVVLAQNDRLFVLPLCREVNGYHNNAVFTASDFEDKERFNPNGLPRFSREHVIQGIELFIASLKSKNRPMSIFDWAFLPTVTNLIVREVPIRTRDLRPYLFVQNADFENEITKAILNGRKAEPQDQSGFENKGADKKMADSSSAVALPLQSKPTFQALFPRRHLVYTRTFAEMLAEGLIPSFYALVTDNLLYDVKGEKVTIKENLMGEKKLAELGIDSSRADEDGYNNPTPFDYFKEHAKDLVTNDKNWDALFQVVDDFMLPRKKPII